MTCSCQNAVKAKRRSLVPYSSVKNANSSALQYLHKQAHFLIFVQMVAFPRRSGPSASVPDAVLGLETALASQSHTG
jgi:hypothetical protein